MGTQTVLSEVRRGASGRLVCAGRKRTVGGKRKGDILVQDSKTPYDRMGRKEEERGSVCRCDAEEAIHLEKRDSEGEKETSNPLATAAGEPHVGEESC